MLKFLMVTIICCLATAFPSNDRLTKLETMVAEQQTAMEEQRAVVGEQQATVKKQGVTMKEQRVVMQQALEDIRQLKRNIAGTCINIYLQSARRF